MQVCKVSFFVIDRVFNLIYSHQYAYMIVQATHAITSSLCTHKSKLGRPSMPIDITIEVEQIKIEECKQEKKDGV